MKQKIRWLVRLTQLLSNHVPSLLSLFTIESRIFIVLPVSMFLLLHSVDVTQAYEPVTHLSQSEKNPDTNEPLTENTEISDDYCVSITNDCIDQAVKVALPLEPVLEIEPTPPVNMVTNAGPYHRYHVYSVQSGDTIYGLARKFYLKVETILEANIHLKDNPDKLHIGQQLIIPPAHSYHQVDNNNTIQQKTALFRWPIQGIITQDYVNSHLALDIDGWVGQPVFAAASGQVITAGWDESGYGRMVIIDHGNNLKTLYAHLDSYSVAIGDEVVKGQQIGEIGQTGTTTGSHLHLEVIAHGIQRNPWSYLP